MEACFLDIWFLVLRATTVREWSWCLFKKRPLPYGRGSLGYLNEFDVVEGGEGCSPIDDFLRLDFNAQYGFFISEFCDDFAHRIDDERAAGVVEVWIVARAIGGDDIGLVFDGASDAQASPMSDAGGWPVGTHDECLGAVVESHAEEFGEAEVVADGGDDGERLVARDPLVGGEFIACCIGFAFASEGEWMELGVFTGW